MRLRLQIALLVAATLYMGWGLALLLAPIATQSLISTYANDPVMSRMFGISLIAWTIAFCIGARHPEREIVQASIVAMLAVSLVVSYSTFFDGSMPRTAPMAVSLGLNSALAVFLLATRLGMAYREWRGQQRPAPGPSPARGRPAPATGPKPPAAPEKTTKKPSVAPDGESGGKPDRVQKKAAAPAPKVPEPPEEPGTTPAATVASAASEPAEKSRTRPAAETPAAAAKSKKKRAAPARRKSRAENGSASKP
ncbi:MAG: hypothetical protein LJE84_03185 [Gammaproteobacteria bacterium]|nr:hypothetical protein [Gammaproteobacteria bacterium]